MTAQFIYTGPSWAKQSYDDDRLRIPLTNVAQQWGIDCIDVSEINSNTETNLQEIKNTRSALPVIWIYNEPIKMLKKATGLTAEEFLQRSDWRDIWHECNQYCLKLINSLNRPVLLIGGHSDIVDCDYANITVAHASYQQWISKQCGVDFAQYSENFCWGAEVVHGMIYGNPCINPPQDMVLAVSNIFRFWKAMEMSGWFWQVHPNRRAIEAFATFIKPTVEQFLQDNQ